MNGDPLPPPGREVLQQDGVAWLRGAQLRATMAIVTSLPDHSELPALGFEGWRSWFGEVAGLCCRKIAPRSVAVFYQTDVKHEGRWIDKAYLVQRAAEQVGSELLWHKVVCRTTPGTTTFGRPAYAHMLCFSRELRLEPGQSSPDVLPELGEMPWARAMGAQACRAVTKFLREHTRCDTVIDPFCGHGTMLAVANAEGLDAIGIELSAKRARKARALQLG